jgi:hypothetical protein
MLINSTLKCGGKEVPPKLRSGRVIRVLKNLIFISIGQMKRKLGNSLGCPL